MSFRSSAMAAPVSCSIFPLDLEMVSIEVAHSAVTAVVLPRAECDRWFNLSATHALPNPAAHCSISFCISDISIDWIPNLGSFDGVQGASLPCVLRL